MCSNGCEHRERRGAWLTANAWMGVSAVVMLVTLLTLWTRPGSAVEPTALANPMVSSAGNITLMTTESGIDEVLLVLDGRNELLLVYRVENAASVELLQRTPVPQMFADAKLKAAGHN